MNTCSSHFSAFLAVVVGSVGIGVVANPVASDTLVRRQVAAHKFGVELGASGELVKMKKATHKSIDTCNIDFALGAMNSWDDCLGHDAILDDGMCLAAAQETGAHTMFSATNSVKNFSIANDLRNQRPKGCFMHPCEEGEAESGGACFFYNEADFLPEGSEVQGRPVCMRPKLKDATGGACPDGYKAIAHQETCMSAASCLNEALGAQFQIGLVNKDDEKKHPIGCFFNNQGDDADHDVYFNPADGLTESDLTNPEGTSLCNVTEVVRFPGTSPALE